MAVKTRTNLLNNPPFKLYTQLQDLSRKKLNSSSLPVQSVTLNSLPPDEQCLTKPNYQIEPGGGEEVVHKPATSMASPYKQPSTYPQSVTSPIQYSMTSQPKLGAHFLPSTSQNMTGQQSAGQGPNSNPLPNYTNVMNPQYLAMRNMAISNASMPLNSQFSILTTPGGMSIPMAQNYILQSATNTATPNLSSISNSMQLPTSTPMTMPSTSNPSLLMPSTPNSSMPRPPTPNSNIPMPPNSATVSISSVPNSSISIPSTSNTIPMPLTPNSAMPSTPNSTLVMPSTPNSISMPSTPNSNVIRPPTPNSSNTAFTVPSPQANNLYSN
eukprot:TRINITY_DN3788_c0_g1_i1.p1 TRINITY_DN3788_c0_g1~~TRINITY_DN3788_c0_g1_i1.p1  ORF type:complete len:326 (+),score=33.36 TRINITY_DN3788_c0_g1_i1:151-1128(+)